jgi:uncharacterized phage-like protein YoqJ
MVYTFAGHRDAYCAGLDDMIRAKIEELLCDDAEFTFLSGNMGRFDRLCEKAVRAAKRAHPELRIRLVAVLPYMTGAVNSEKERYAALYGDVLIPEKLMGAHYRAAISLRNRWMVEQADGLIAYVERRSGGAYAMMRYAAALDVRVINLALAIYDYDCGKI